jgi:hypothetical protein
MVFEENQLQSRYALDPGFKARDLNFSAPEKESDPEYTPRESGRNGPFSEVSEAPIPQELEQRPVIFNEVSPSEPV